MADASLNGAFILAHYHRCLSSCNSDERSDESFKQSKIFVGSKKYPVLKNFMELIAAFFKAGCVGVDAFADGNFTIVRAIIGQNFIGCMAHGGVYVVQQHDTPAWVLLQTVMGCILPKMLFYFHSQDDAFVFYITAKGHGIIQGRFPVMPADEHNRKHGACFKLNRE